MRSSFIVQFVSFRQMVESRSGLDLTVGNNTMKSSWIVGGSTLASL